MSVWLGDYAVDVPGSRQAAETLPGTSRFVNQVRIYLEEQERNQPLTGDS